MMAGERGQNITLRFGGVSAPVSLLKTSGKPREAMHETRRVLVTIDLGGPSAAQIVAENTGRPVVDEQVTEPQRQRVAQELAADPLGDGDDLAAARARLDDPTIEANRILLPEIYGDAGSSGQTVPGGPVASGPAPYTPPETTVQQGIHLADGTWLDLTDRLAEVDRLTKVDGLEVVATIASNAVPRQRVRDAHYVAGSDPATYKVLALLWDALRAEGAAAVVRWTKRTAQALGIVVARGGGAIPAHLVLLELEWAQNMRPVPERASGPVHAVTTADERDAAAELVMAFYRPVSALDELADTRLAKRAELLALARDGKLDAYDPPPEPMPEPDDAAEVAQALAMAAAWVRERTLA
ncbi:MAG: hypothetical protein LC798_15425 [Chloroflexi bacterium]|nr:hypothetical protein [Chloroflexota bacterium]